MPSAGAPRRCSAKNPSRSGSQSTGSRAATSGGTCSHGPEQQPPRRPDLPVRGRHRLGKEVAPAADLEGRHLDLRDVEHPLAPVAVAGGMRLPGADVELLLLELREPGPPDPLPAAVGVAEGRRGQALGQHQRRPLVLAEHRRHAAGPGHVGGDVEQRVDRGDGPQVRRPGHTRGQRHETTVRHAPDGNAAVAPRLGCGPLDDLAGVGGLGARIERLGVPALGAAVAAHVDQQVGVAAGREPALRVGRERADDVVLAVRVERDQGRVGAGGLGQVQVGGQGRAVAQRDEQVALDGHPPTGPSAANRRSTFPVIRETSLSPPFVSSAPHQAIEPVEKTAPPFGRS